MDAMPDQPTAVFFFRAYNDIDHLVPVIDRLQTDTDLRIRLVVTDPFNDYRSDYRIRYLERAYGHRPVHILPYYPVAPWVIRAHRAASRLAERLPRAGRLLRSALVTPLARRIIRAGEAIDVRRLFRDLLGPNRQRAIIIFDHQMSSLVQLAGALARERGYPMLSLPHAVENWDNELINTHQLSIEPDTTSRKSYNLYDAVVFPDAYAAQRTVTLGLEESRVRIIGSPRFSAQWMTKLDREVTPTYNLPAVGPDKLRVVYFLTKPRHNVFQEEALRTIHYLRQFPGVYLIIKPHTRGMRFGMDDLGEGCMVVDNDVPSQVLIDWADLILYTATSVILDALRKDKPVLYLANTLANKLIFERFIKTWEVRCRDELRDWMWRFLEDRQTRTYTREEADRCLAELVDGKTPDVLASYIELIQEYASKET